MVGQVFPTSIFLYLVNASPGEWLVFACYLKAVAQASKGIVHGEGWRTAAHVFAADWQSDVGWSQQ